MELHSINIKCLNCNKNHNKDFNKELINRFLSTHKFVMETLIDYFDAKKMSLSI